MTGPIKFKTTDEATLVTALGNGRQHDTTPAEFDVVAESRGYITAETLTKNFDAVARESGYAKSTCGTIDALTETLDILGLPKDTTTNVGDVNNAIRRIIAERDMALLGDPCGKCRNDRDSLRSELGSATSHTCTIDGVEYRGNEETIEELRGEHGRANVNFKYCETLTKKVAELKRQLASANEQIQTLGLMHAQEQAKNKAPFVQTEPIDLDKGWSVVFGVGPARIGQELYGVTTERFDELARERGYVPKVGY